VRRVALGEALQLRAREFLLDREDATHLCALVRAQARASARIDKLRLLLPLYLKRVRPNDCRKNGGWHVAEGRLVRRSRARTRSRHVLTIRARILVKKIPKARPAHGDKRRSLPLLDEVPHVRVRGRAAEAESHAEAPVHVRRCERERVRADLNDDHVVGERRTAGVHG